MSAASLISFNPRRTQSREKNSFFSFSVRHRVLHFRLILTAKFFLHSNERVNRFRAEPPRRRIIQIHGGSRITIEGLRWKGFTREVKARLFVDMSIQNNVLGPLPPQAGPDPYSALANFDVIKALGQGHFSLVYSARNRFTGTHVALKKVEVREWFHFSISTSSF